MRSLDVKRTLGDLADDRNVMSASLSLYTTHNCTNCTDCLRSGHARMGVDVKSQSAKREQMRTQKLAFQGKCLRRDKYEHIGARRNGLLPRYVAPTDTHERARVNSQSQASRPRRRRTQTSAAPRGLVWLSVVYKQRHVGELRIIKSVSRLNLTQVLTLSLTSTTT